MIDLISHFWSLIPQGYVDPYKKVVRKETGCGREILRPQRALCAKFEGWALFKGKTEGKGKRRSEKENTRYTRPYWATLSPVSHAIHPSSLAARASSTSSSPTSLPTPDSSKKCRRRPSQRGLFRSTRMLSGFFPSHASARAARNLAFACPSGCKMTRSHVLLNCPNPKLTAARLDAWGIKKPSGVRALLSNPRWERRLLLFLDRSGVGRTVAGGKDPDVAWADRRDQWIILFGKGGDRGSDNLVLFSSLLFS